MTRVLQSADTPRFAIRSMLTWINQMPYDRWPNLVHRKGGSM